MRARLTQLLHILKLDFGKVKLSWLLAAINIFLVLGLVGGISLTAVNSLRRLADSQGTVRVQLAGSTARDELRKASEDLLTAARGIATRSTLRRLVDEEPVESLAPFLRRACQTANADLCAVWQGNQVLAQTSTQIAWRDVLTASREQGERFMLAPTSGPSAALGAMLGAVAYTDDAGSTPLRVYAVKLLDDKLAKQLSERVDLPVRFVNFRSFSDQPADSFTQLHSAAISDGRSAAARIDSQGVFASSYPVFASTGETIALIETRLDTMELDEYVHALVRRLLITAIVLGALALVAAVILARFVIGPVRALTEAAGRLGQGDFSTSIPATGAAEVGVLARTMEDMRRNLVGLTTALRQREAEAQAVLNGVVEGVFAVDKQRHITYLNPQAASMLGVHVQDAIGHFCGDVLKPCKKNGELPCELACPILQAREGANARVVEPLERDGGARSTIITSAPPVDGLQVQVIRDETELEAVRRARDSVLANISHEFRTPLAAQLASIELLRDGLDAMNDSQRRDLVMSLERGTHRLTRLIDNLLESVRIESGQLAIRRQTLLLSEVIDDARELLGSLFEQRGQTLVVELPDTLPWIEGDALRLTQVFVNLLANANKYAPEGSTIRVSAQATAHNIVAWVEDEGPGVPGSNDGSIFDRFSRGKAEEPEPGGLGLGLWIVKSIVERHGGTVRAERTADNKTRFSVTLPGAAQ